MYLNITLLVIKDWKYYWAFNLSFHNLHMSLFSDCCVQCVQCVHMFFPQVYFTYLQSIHVPIFALFPEEYVIYMYLQSLMLALQSLPEASLSLKKVLES